MFGTLLWNPLELLTHIQETSYTPAARAGTFFAGLGLLATQSQSYMNMLLSRTLTNSLVSMNLILNVQLYGMDLAGLFLVGHRWSPVVRGRVRDGADHAPATAGAREPRGPERRGFVEPWVPAFAGTQAEATAAAVSRAGRAGGRDWRT